MEFDGIFPSNHHDTIEFFRINFQEESRGWRLDKAEVIYVASVLASHAQTSLDQDIPLADLYGFLDEFVLKPEGPPNSGRLELAGAHSLLLAGFFREQMQRRHNVKWYEGLGRDFYKRAAKYTENKTRKALLEMVSDDFGVLADICANLNKNFQENAENRYLIRI